MTTDATRCANVLALKLAAWLLLAGAVFAAAGVFAIAWLAMRPGTALCLALSERNGVASMGVAIVVLTAAVVILIAFAATHSIMRRAAKADGGSPEEIGAKRLQSRRQKRSLVVLAAGVLFLASVFGLRWFRSLPADLPAAVTEGTSTP